MNVRILSKRIALYWCNVSLDGDVLCTFEIESLNEAEKKDCRAAAVNVNVQEFERPFVIAFLRRDFVPPFSTVNP